MLHHFVPQVFSGQVCLNKILLATAEYITSRTMFHLTLISLRSHNLWKIELSPEECVNPAYKLVKFQPFG